MNALQSLGKRFARLRSRPRRPRHFIGTRQARFEELEDRVVLDGGSFLLPEFSIQVNPDGIGPNRQPTVDIAPDGGFVVAWQNSRDIYSRAYRSNMSPKQAEPPNLTAEADPDFPDLWTNDQSPDVATNNSGESVVVWNGPIEYSSYNHAMFFQQLAPNGTPDLARPGTVYEDYAYFKDNKVAVTDSGDFVVAWTEADPDPDADPLFESDVYCRFFHEDGTPYDAPLDVASSNLYEFVDGVAVDSVEHNSVVVWRQSPVASADNYEIYFCMYDFSGGEVDELVEPTLVGSGTDASVAMDEDGNFLIAWLHEGDIYAQRFTDQGATSGSPVLLVDSEPNLFDSHTNLDVSICGLQGVVGYEQYTGGYSHYESFIQQFHFAGGSVAPGIRRSLGATANGLYLNAGPSVAMNESGHFVVAYIRDYDHSVRVREFRPDGTSVWPGAFYVFPHANLLPLWGASNTVQMGARHFDVIGSTSPAGTTKAPTPAEALGSLIHSATRTDSTSHGADTGGCPQTYSTLSSLRSAFNDEALLAVIDEQDGLLTNIPDDLDKFAGFPTAASRCSLSML